jgi:hypothetical protein
VRRGLLALVVLTSLMSAPATAHALNVRQQLYTFIEAAPGEKNTVTWYQSALGIPDGAVYITDATAPITMSGNYPCRRVTLHTVACDDASAFINLGDGNDSFMGSDPNGGFCRPCGVQFTVFGGPGDDTIVPGNNSSSSSYGEGGKDTIVVTSNETYNAYGGSGNDKLVLPRGYTGRLYGGRIFCEGGLDRLVWPRGDPPPSDCENVTYLPAAVKQLPEPPGLLP